MLPIVNSRTEEGKKLIRSLADRRFELASNQEDTVREILEDVRVRGDEALVDFTRRYDSETFRTEHIAVSEAEVKAAYSEVDDDFIRIIRKAISNVHEFHRRQLDKSWFMTRQDGVILGQSVLPVEAAGLYVPGGQGGTTPLVSSVVMNGVPAVLAGVNRIILATPPGEGNRVSPHLLVTAAEVGVHEIYRIGSAWAIGAMVFGTGTVRPVNVVVGPGNIFVTLAKKLVAGMVGIDMVAGPSEVLVLADDTPSPRCLAADMLSQAEHDPMATAILLTTSEKVARDVDIALEELATGLERGEIARSSIMANGAILVVSSLEEAAEIANLIGPEHLELAVNNPWALLPLIKNAGAVFMGEHTPEPIGDYIAGPNHVLPTMGTAKFASALGVETFLKRSSIIAYSRKAFLDDASDVVRMAEIEGLTAHALSIRVRLENETGDGN